MWLESMGVVVRRYIDFLILLIPTQLLFAAISLLFCSNFLCFFVLVYVIFMQFYNKE